MKPMKRDVFRALLLRGSVFVHLDPKKPMVIVPQHLVRKDQVVLQFGLDMPVPIPDIRSDNTILTGTLSFNGTPHLCVIPWDAVFALVGEDAKGMIWEESMSAPVKREIQAQDRRQKFGVIQGGRAASKGPTARSNTRLRSV